MPVALARRAIVVACCLFAATVQAGRLTPSTRLSNLTVTSGAQSTTASIPASTTWALIAFCYYSGTSNKDPTTVSLDGQTATLIDSAHDNSAANVALYKVSGFATGAGKTLAWTNAASYSFIDAAIEYRDGTPTYGAHGSAFSAGFPGTAATSSLANSSGDEILSAYCVNRNAGAGSPTVGSGQSKLDETDDAIASNSAIYGFTTETGSGSADAQSVDGDTPGIASTVVSIASGAFDVSPTVTSRTTSAYTVTGSLSGAGTVKAVACHAGLTAPTIAEINAARCTGSSTPSASGTQSPGSGPFDFSIVLTPSESPVFPVYDLYATDGVTRVTIAGQLLSPPSNCGANSDQPCQFVQLLSVDIGGIASIATLAYDAQTQNFIVGDTVTGGTSGAVGQIMADSDVGVTGTLTLWISSGTFQDNEALTGAIRGVATVNGAAVFFYAANDVLIAPTYVSPCGATCALTISTDGNASYVSGSELETALNIRIYDYDAIGYAAGDIDFVNNDLPPTCFGGTVTVSGGAASSFSYNLQTVCSDPEGAAMTSVALDALPAGLTHSGATNITSGTPSSIGSTTVEYVLIDQYNAVTAQSVRYSILGYFDSPDCTSSPTLLEDCEAAYGTALSGLVTFSLTARCDNHVAAGYVIATSPKAGAQVVAGANIGIAYSNLKPCGTPVSMVSCLRLSVSACQTLVTNTYGTAVSLSSNTGTCPAGYTSGLIFEQSPAVNRKVSTPATLSVSACP